MKKYKLKKDFPSSNIGDVWVKADNVFMSPEGRESIKMHEHLFKPFDEWFEDYEDPKEYWCIDWTGDIHHITVLEGTDEYEENKKQIGNYFETKEAEKAVEKLKAFKRLQELGFKFEGVRFRNNHSYIEWKIEPKNELTDDEVGKLMEDLYEVFGGKE